MSKTKIEKLRLATWNINRSKETLQIMSFFKTLLKYEIVIACLQETALTDDRDFKNSTYTILYSGKPKADMRKFHGVGLVVRKDLLKQLQIKELPPESAERLMYCKFQTSVGRIHIINVYSPTENKDSDENDTFYEDLEDILLEVPESESVFIAGDFNAHIGAENEAWTTCIGQYGVGTMNYNGLRLLEFCTFHNMCITNTYFNVEDNEKVTHSSTKYWHQLDLIVTRQRDIGCVNKIKACIDLEHTDHCMVSCLLTFSQKQKHNSGLRGKNNPNYSVGHKEESDESLHLIKFVLSQHLLSKSMPDPDIKINWSKLKDYIRKSFPFNEHQQIKTFKFFYKKFKQKITHFKIAMMIWKKNKSNKHLLKWTCRKREVEQVVLDYLKEIKSNVYQTEEIKKVLHNQLVELKKIDNDGKLSKSKFSKLDWSRFKELPSRNDLNYGIEFAFTQKELKSIPETRKQNIFKMFRERQSLMHSFLACCWKSGHVPLKICCARMPIFSLSSLCSIKVIRFIFEAILVKRLSLVKGNSNHFMYYPQIALRQLRPEADMTTSVKKIQDMLRTNKIPLFMAFLDLYESLNKTYRSFQLNFLLLIGCPEALVRFIAHLIGEKNKDSSELTLQIYDIFWYYITNTYLKKKDAICIKPKQPIPSYPCLYLHGLYCGEKVVIFANSKEKLKQRLENIEQGLKLFGITIFACDKLNKPSLQILGELKPGTQKETLTILSKTFPINGIVQFCGVVFARNIPLEIQYIIHHATRKMAELWFSNAFESKNEKIKLDLYKELILRELVSQSEFMTRNTVQEYKLNTFHVKSLRRILGKKAKAKQSSQILMNAEFESIQKLLIQERRKKNSKIKSKNYNVFTQSIFWGELIIKNKETNTSEKTGPLSKKFHQQLKVPKVAPLWWNKLPSTVKQKRKN